jgi:methionyl aminopeptidase
MIYIKTHEEYKALKESGKIVAEVLHTLENNIKENVTTLSLNTIAEKIILKNKGIPAFKGYKGFPFSICTSVNNEALHGFPSKYSLLNGDIISIDVGVSKNNFCGDAAFTKIVGDTSKKNKLLVKTTKLCLYEAIKHFKNNCKVGDISNIIHQTAFVNGFNVIKKYGGHGVGKRVHENPYIPNSGLSNKGNVLKEHSCIAIEPVLTSGSDSIIVSDNDWTIRSSDGAITAHFEHTVFLTHNGPEILTYYK